MRIGWRGGCSQFGGGSGGERWRLPSFFVTFTDMIFRAFKLFISCAPKCSFAFGALLE